MADRQVPAFPARAGDLETQSLSSCEVTRTVALQRLPRIASPLLTAPSHEKPHIKGAGEAVFLYLRMTTTELNHSDTAAQNRWARALLEKHMCFFLLSPFHMPINEASVKDGLAEVHLAKHKVESMSCVLLGLHGQTKHFHVYLKTKGPVSIAGAKDFF